MADKNVNGFESAPLDPARLRAGSTRKGRGLSRRSLCVGAGSIAVLAGIGGLRFTGTQLQCRPPGGQDEDHVLARCIRCEQCMETCPREVIVPVHAEDGLVQMRTPRMSFDEGYCDFCAESNDGRPRCVQVCPTGALEFPENASARRVVLGVAAIDTMQCLAYRDAGCRFCYDACIDAGYGAIVLESDGYSAKPKVDGGKCVGCGACEAVCASLQSGSIASGASQRAIVVCPLDAV